MTKQLVAILASVSLTLGTGAALAEHKPGQAEEHLHNAGTAAESAYVDVIKHRACAHCGMDREKFSHSRMLVTYTDGTSAGVCSIHCAVTKLKASTSKAVKSVEVADLNNRKLVDVEKAAWVIGGSMKGVMTKTAKWAFAKKDDADAFVKKHGGKPATYIEAHALAEKD